MAREDREQSFEQALARNLRDNAPTAGGRRRVCADAETLAAYHERLLAPEEMTFWKEHIASCSRCQQILAHVEETDAIPVDLQQEENAEPVRHAQTPPVLQISKPHRAKRWLWTAPAGAIAAALLVWVAVHERPPQLEVPKNQPAPASLPPASSRSEAAAQLKEALPKDEIDGRESAVRTRADAVTERRAQELLDGKSSRLSSADKPSKKKRDDRLAEQLAEFGRQVTPQVQLAPSPNNERKKLDAHSAAPAAPPPLPTMTETVEVTPSAPEVNTQAAQLDSIEKAKPAPAAQAQQKQQELQQIGGMSRFKQAPSMRLANSKRPAMITSPGRKVNWQLGAAGMIERSEDAGATWTIQTSGVVADLLVGSAVSDQVCWVGGQLGTILRTTDGGAHWVKVRSPVEDDILSVFAVSARQATISNARGTYQTTDGGITWNKLAPE